VEQRCARAQDAGELVVESLRIQFTRDAETRRIVQGGIEAGGGQGADRLRDVGMGELEALTMVGGVRIG
jgi:hypothetical protein